MDSDQTKLHLTFNQVQWTKKILMQIHINTLHSRDILVENDKANLSKIKVFLSDSWIKKYDI